jgi:hypothetical protein
MSHTHADTRLCVVGVWGNNLKERREQEGKASKSCIHHLFLPFQSLVRTWRDQDDLLPHGQRGIETINISRAIFQFDFINCAVGCPRTWRLVHSNIRENERRTRKKGRERERKAWDKGSGGCGPPFPFFFRFISSKNIAYKDKETAYNRVTAIYRLI